MEKKDRQSQKKADMIEIIFLGNASHKEDSPTVSELLRPAISVFSIVDIVPILIGGLDDA